MARRVERTRNGGTWTEAKYWSQIRGALRKSFAWWKPAQAALKAAEAGTVTNPATGRPNKAYRCASCENRYKRTEVYLDHVTPCGSLRCENDVLRFLATLTSEDVNDFQVLCSGCHQAKTNEERANHD